MTDKLLIVFTKNLIEGKVKTRLAGSIGNHAALKVYSILLDHTRQITQELNFDMHVGYSEYIDESDSWASPETVKFVQKGSDLGIRMMEAFKDGFRDGYNKIVLIGSDCYNLESSHLKEAFERLEDHEFVFGPAMDGGYYLVGMTAMNEKIFQNKSWGTNTVLDDTLKHLPNEAVFLLEALNDIDTLEDLKGCQDLLNRIESNDKIY